MAKNDFKLKKENNRVEKIIIDKNFILILIAYFLKNPYAGTKELVDFIVNSLQSRGLELSCTNIKDVEQLKLKYYYQQIDKNFKIDKYLNNEYFSGYQNENINSFLTIDSIKKIFPEINDKQFIHIYSLVEELCQQYTVISREFKTKDTIVYGDLSKYDNDSFKDMQEGYINQILYDINKIFDEFIKNSSYSFEVSILLDLLRFVSLSPMEVNSEISLDNLKHIKTLYGYKQYLHNQIALRVIKSFKKYLDDKQFKRYLDDVMGNEYITCLIFNVQFSIVNTILCGT